MRPTILASASALTVAALLGAASAASAETAPVQGQGRVLSWPGKTAAPAPVQDEAFVAPHRGFGAAPAAVPPPFTAASTGGARVNNRYSPRSGAPRLASRTPVRPAPTFTQPYIPAPAYAAPVYTAPVYPAPVYAPPAPVYAPPAYVPPAYTPPVYVPAPVAMPEPMTDYGPPVIPNMVKPAPVISAPAPIIVEAAPAPQPLAAKVAPAPLAAAPVAKAAKSRGEPQAAPVQAAAATASGDRPFIRPASSNGPRFYSVHREYGATPDATFRSKPDGLATERLPAGFFAAGEPATEEEEVQDDAETRAAAVRTAEKQLKAKGKKR